MNSSFVPIDEQKLMNFMHKAVSDLGATVSSSLVVVGEKFGFYKVMAGAGPITASEISKKTGVIERYVSEWLDNQAAGGYITYDPQTKTYFLPDEHAACLADEKSPTYLLGAFQSFTSMVKDEPKVVQAFKNGNGINWGDHHCDLYEGTERFFKTGYVANLLSLWIPSLDGIEAKLKSGIKVADIGCGHGSSTILMAKEFPESEFIGFDFHEPSIKTAQKRAQEAGLDNNIRFEVADSTNFPGKNYDFVTIFDALHDMGNPSGVSEHVLHSLEPDGSWMIVEPFASDKTEENHNPLGRLFFGASTTVCVPCSLASNGPGLGAQAGPKKIEDIVKGVGFTKFRIATKNPFNIIYETKP